MTQEQSERRKGHSLSGEGRGIERGKVRTREEWRKEGTHFLESAEAFKSGQERERDALTSWRAQRERRVRTRKARACKGRSLPGERTGEGQVRIQKEIECA